MQKLTILSSVPEWIFGSIANNPSFGFTQAESQSALKDEKQVFIDAIGIPDIEKYVKVEVLRVMDGIPKDHSADAYILGGSPAMVTERDQKEWVDRLIRFVGVKVEDGTPLFGICFGSQVLATAVWGKVDWMKERVIGRGSILVDGESIDSIWSHQTSHGIIWWSKDLIWWGKDCDPSETRSHTSRWQCRAITYSDDPSCKCYWCTVSSRIHSRVYRFFGEVHAKSARIRVTQSRWDPRLYGSYEWE
jgi:hypothetical protein